jgi:outer membrane receptor protein involved in Fe transport
VDYGYDYVSYSVGVNYRIAEPVSVFGRYSRGGRAAAERQLFSPTQFNSTTGQLVDSSTAYGEVEQAEARRQVPPGRPDGLCDGLLGLDG